jgi:hypothetical protein
METIRRDAWSGTVFGRCVAAAVFGAMALVAAPKADALTLMFEDLGPGLASASVSDGDALDQSNRAGVISIANLEVGNFVIDVATARSNALTGELPAYLNVNVTAFGQQAGQLRVTAWDDYFAGPGEGLPAFFATSATLRGDADATSRAWIVSGDDTFQIGSPVSLTGTDASGHRSTTVALGETFRIYQEFVITSRGAENITNIDGFVEVIPVPAALPLMLGGLGVLGFMGWRRKAA